MKDLVSFLNENKERYDASYKEKYYGAQISMCPEDLSKVEVGPAKFENAFTKSKIKMPPALPSTEIADKCYMGMFAGCKELLEAPTLPAEKLYNECYESMFAGCTKIKETPELVASKLAKMCYTKMFNNCTALTTAIIEAESLEEGCCIEMFSGCKNIKDIWLGVKKNITASEIDKYFKNWLEDTNNTGTLHLREGVKAAKGLLPKKWKVTNDYETSYK